MSHRVAQLACTVMLSACLQSDPVATAHPSIVVSDQRSVPAAETTIASIDGTYGKGCVDASSAWSLAIQGVAASSLDYPSLAITSDNTDCVLTVTGVRTANGSLLLADSPITLDSSYLDTAVAFGQPPVFYANLRLESWDARAGYEVGVAYSEDMDRVAANTLDTASATLQNESVPAPDYDVDISEIAIETDLDDIVVSVQGSAIVTAHGVEASRYAIAPGSLSIYAALDAAYLRGNLPLTSAIAGTQFDLVGTDLSSPQVRTLILANVVNGVTSYQALVLRFASGTASAQ